MSCHANTTNKAVITHSFKQKPTSKLISQKRKLTKCDNPDDAPQTEQCEL